MKTENYSDILLKAFNALFDLRFPSRKKSSELIEQEKEIAKKKVSLHDYLKDTVFAETVFVILVIGISVFFYDNRAERSFHVFIPGVVTFAVWRIYILIQHVRIWISLSKDISASERELSRRGYRYFKKAQHSFLTLAEQINLLSSEQLSEIENPEKLSELLQDKMIERVRNYPEYPLSKYEESISLNMLNTISYLGLMNTDKSFILTDRNDEFDSIIEQRSRWLYKNLKSRLSSC